MIRSLEEKIDLLKKKFSSLNSPEEKYAEIIEMGRRLSPLSTCDKSEENLIKGCQSRLYLHSWLSEEKVYFAAEADALISAGLAAILTSLYSGEAPETVLKYPPHFLIELDILPSLSPHRSNGLAHIYLRMKQDAVKFLLLTHSK